MANQDAKRTQTHKHFALKNDDMKKYLEDSDLFIDFRYVPNVPNAKDGEECEHKCIVDGVELFHAIQGEFQTTYIKVYLTEKQIISAYENIQKIESEKVVMQCE